MDFFISWAAPKEAHPGWYLYIGLLLVISLPLVLELGFLRRLRQQLAILLCVFALTGFLVLSTSDMGLAWPTIVTDITNQNDHEMRDAMVQGEKVYFKYGCPNCHQIGDFGVPAGPNLAGYGAVMNRDYLTRYMLDYQGRGLVSVMPDYRQMSEEELRLLLDFMEHL